jgi:hypothetical protein
MTSVVEPEPQESASLLVDPELNAVAALNLIKKLFENVTK